MQQNVLDQSVNPSTLSQAVFRQSGLARDLLLVLGGAALVALCAQIEVPLKPVPMTLQTLAVLLVGAALGSRRGALALLTYLGAGAAGLPVFAGGKGSLLSAAGALTPTLGYLLGFVLAAALVGGLAERLRLDRTPWGMALAMLAGNAVIYIPGLAWLAYSFSLSGQKLLAAGLTPFLLGDALKLALAAALLPAAWALLGRRKP